MENASRYAGIAAAAGISTAVFAMFAMCGLSRSDPQGPLLFFVGPFLSLWWGVTAAMLTLGSLFLKSGDRDAIPGAMLVIPGGISLTLLLGSIIASLVGR